MGLTAKTFLSPPLDCLSCFSSFLTHSSFSSFLSGSCFFLIVFLEIYRADSVFWGFRLSSFLIPFISEVLHFLIYTITFTQLTWIRSSHLLSPCCGFILTLRSLTKHLLSGWSPAIGNISISFFQSSL